jgi:hypothetical protein
MTDGELDHARHDENQNPKERRPVNARIRSQAPHARMKADTGMSTRETQQEGDLRAALSRFANCDERHGVGAALTVKSLCEGENKVCGP